MSLTQCNICLKQDCLLIPVNARCPDNLTVLQKLELVSPFQNWLGCFSICNNCNDLLEAAHQFIILCSKHQSERLNFLAETNRMSSEDGALKTPNKTVLPREEQMEIITIKVVESQIEPQIEGHELDFQSEDNHYNSIINNCNESKCLKCNKVFPNNYELGLHISINHGFNCKICSKNFRTKGSLGQHIRLEHPKKITCETCGESFSNPKDLVVHCVSQHSLKSNEVKPFMCNICDKRFTIWTSLTRHLLYHEGTRNYTCKVCGKCFVTKKDVDMHELIHSNEKQLCCKTCGKCFNTLSNLCTHTKCVHSDPSKRKYECYLCSKRFALKATLEEHIKRHIGLKEHLCMICGVSFVSKYDLKRHTYCHTKERPYKCKFCENKSYRDGKGLKQHIEKCHSVITMD